MWSDIMSSNIISYDLKDFDIEVVTSCMMMNIWHKSQFEWKISPLRQANASWTRSRWSWTWSINRSRRFEPRLTYVNMWKPWPIDGFPKKNGDFLHRLSLGGWFLISQWLSLSRSLREISILNCRIPIHDIPDYISIIPSM